MTYGGASKRDRQRPALWNSTCPGRLYIRGIIEFQAGICDEDAPAHLSPRHDSYLAEVSRLCCSGDREATDPLILITVELKLHSTLSDPPGGTLVLWTLVVIPAYPKQTQLTKQKSDQKAGIGRSSPQKAPNARLLMPITVTMQREHYRWYRACR